MPVFIACQIGNEYGIAYAPDERKAVTSVLSLSQKKQNMGRL
jgi:hypothetical protein